MLITNKTKLSQSLYDVIVKINSKYSKGKADYSATELIGSPRISILTSQYNDILEEDASDLIWRFMGNVVHEIIANMDNNNVLSEERLYGELNGTVISGAPDRYDGRIGTDYKFTSKYAVKNGVKEEWECQSNIYKWLLHVNGFPNSQFQIEAILKDARGLEPKTKILDVNMWNIDIITEYIQNRIAIHKYAKDTLPLCTYKETWYSGTVFAIMKKDRKSAVKLFNTSIEASNYLDTLNDKHYITTRLGIHKRCENYCVVSNKCDQWQEIKGGGV